MSEKCFSSNQNHADAAAATMMPRAVRMKKGIAVLSSRKAAARDAMTKPNQKVYVEM